jgi:hypothetical protein
MMIAIAVNRAAGHPQREVRHGGVDRRGDRHRFRREQEACATGQEHAGQRDDERWQIEDMDHGAHRRAKGRREREDRNKGDKRRHAPALDRERDEDSGEADHRADGKVDAAGDDHEGHADRDDAEKGVIGEEIADHAGGGDVGKLHGAEREARDEHDRRDQDGRQAFHAFVLRSRAMVPARPDNFGDCSSSTAITTTALTSRLNSGG